MGHPAPFQRPSCQGCLEQYHDKVLPTAAGIPRHPYDSGHHLQRPGVHNGRSVGRLPQRIWTRRGNQPASVNSRDSLRGLRVPDGFQTIPEIIISRGRQMMVIVEGRRPHCWSCKQLGHISKFCPQKDPSKAPAAAAATVATETAATTASIVTIRETRKEKEPDQA